MAQAMARAMAHPMAHPMAHSKFYIFTRKKRVKKRDLLTLSNCGLFVAFFRSASPVYYLRLNKFFRHGSQKVLALLTTAKQIVAIQMARENTANKHASE